MASGLFAAPVAAQVQSPDLETYSGWVREAFAAAQRSDRLGLEDAAARLVATTSVRLPDDATIAVDNGWLRDALRETEPDLPAIAERLGAIIDALAQPPSAAPADARERLRQMLDQPPFKRPDPPQAPAWLRDLTDWLVRILERLFEPLGRISPTGGRTVAWAIASVGALLLIGVLVYLLRGLRRGLVSSARADEDDPEANLTAKTALDQAGGLARGGNYRTAVRYLYLSALLWLDERDILRYDRALTNHEYLERVRDNPALRERMAPIVETFDRVWYGHLPIDAEAFAVYERQVEELRREDIG
ncbi:MAG TPA: DUF4129 domain-containing protein [Roseiflexaceae bacterium]|nr:DUF4129 domain-containing protein [Roseiflexaceae bacterium]